MGTDSALYQVVLVAHILCAVVGFGSILVTGGYAGAARRGSAETSDTGQVSDGVRRYFRPGPNVASRFIYAVPVLGLAMAGMGGGGDFGQSWLWVGTGLWLLAAGLAAGVVWPAEARMSSLVTARAVGAAAEQAGAAAELSGAVAQVGQRASRAAAVTDLAVVAAFVVMVARPGG